MAALSAEAGGGPEQPTAIGAALRRLRGHVLWSLASDVAARGASLWLALYAGHLLGVSGFGWFALSMSVVQLAWLGADALLNSAYAAREVARAERDWSALASRFLSIRVAGGAALTALVLAAVTLVPVSRPLRAAVAAASGYFLAYALFPDWLARGLGDFRSLAGANLACAAVTVALTLTLLPAHPTPAAAAAVWSASFAGGAVVLLALLASRHRFRWSPRTGGARWNDHRRASATFAAGGIAAMAVGALPVVLLGFLSSAHETGLFASAFRLVTAALGIGAVVWWPVYTVLARLPRDSAEFRRVSERFLTAMLALGAPVAVTCSIFAEPLMAACFGAEYSRSGVLAILAWAVPLQFLVTAFEIPLLAMSLEARRAANNLAGAAGLVLASVALVPAQGARGAALGYLAALALLLCVHGAAWPGLVRRGWLAGDGARVLAANLVLAAWLALGRARASEALWVVGLVGAALYAGLLAAFGLLSVRGDRAARAAGADRPRPAVASGVP